MRPAGASLFPLVMLGLLAALTLLAGARQRRSTMPAAGQSSPRSRLLGRALHAAALRPRRLDPAHAQRRRGCCTFPTTTPPTVIAPPRPTFASGKTVVTARSAWLDKEGKHVRLDDDVRVVRAGTSDSPETVIDHQRAVSSRPTTSIAQTDAPVTITQGRTVMHGVGLEANNKTQIAVLSGTGARHLSTRNETQ